MIGARSPSRSKARTFGGGFSWYLRSIIPSFARWSLSDQKRTGAVCFATTAAHFVLVQVQSKRWPGFEATDPALLPNRAVLGGEIPPIKPLLDLIA